MQHLIKKHIIRKELSILNKDDFLKIISSITPKEMHTLLENKNRKRKMINVVTIIKDVNRDKEDLYNE